MLLESFLLLAFSAWAQQFYPDDPLIKEPPPRDVGELGRRKLSDIYDLFSHSLRTPGEHMRPGAQAVPARGVNTLGDPMEGAWWERRHYWKRMSPDELRRGPGGLTPPDRSGLWTIVRAKTEGVTPGFTIDDPAGRRYWVKLDSLDYPELSTGADQISGKIFYALGYHVPDNYLVSFRPSQLVIGKDVKITDTRGKKRKFLPADLAALLRQAPRQKDGTIRATASLGLGDIGPYRYYGTRSDDPNDTVPHEHRRDLRGMRMAAAFVDHDDSRAINTMDVIVESGGVHSVRHIQQDFGSTLGSASYKPNSPRSGGEYLFRWKNATVNFLTLGLIVPAWARAHYPDLPSVGRFESHRFDPAHWVPEYPNPAFSNALPDDDFWMAKQIASLSDADIDALVSAAEYSDPRAAPYVAQCLKERRDKIARYAYARVLPLDRFRIENGMLRWDDLAAAAGLGGAGKVDVTWARFDNRSGQRTPVEWKPDLLSAGADSYWVAELRQTQTPAHRVQVFIRKQATRVEIVGKEYQWQNQGPF